MIPIGQASAAGNLTFRSGATIVAKEGISMGVGAGAQKITTDVTGNDTAGMVAGMVASGVTAKGLNGIEAEANKLAKAPKGIDGVTEEAGNLAEDVGKAGKGLEGAESAAEDAGKVVESGSNGGSDVVQSKFNKLLNSDYYKNNPGYDCSEIATDFYDTAGQQGKIYRIEGKDGVINGYEYGKVYDFEYHEVYSDGVYIYDPRYQNTPVLKDDYFRALKEINPDGFDVFTIQ